MEKTNIFGETLGRLVEKKFGRRQQVHAAKALGVTAPQLSNYISGHTVPESATIQRMAEALEVTFAELVGAVPVRAEPFRLPILGTTAAGKPMDPSTEPEEYLEVERLYPEGYYVLKVRGTSMLEHLIANGDFVIVRPVEDADAGEKVVVWIAGEGLTLKPLGPNRTLKIGRKSVPLGPEDKICGVLVGMHRKY